MMTGFLSLFTVCLTCLTMVTHSPLLVSAQVDEIQQETPIFPNGVKSVFIGSSFLIPYAKQFNYFAKRKKTSSNENEFPDHQLTAYQQPGSAGGPHEIWNNNKQDVKALLKGQNVDLFGMHIGQYYNEKKQVWTEPLEHIIHVFRRWIEFALKYNPSTSIFIGMPLKNKPATYDSTLYMNKIQTIGDATFDDVITPLREEFPTTKIYYMNYGILAGEMNKMFDEGELVDIKYKTMDETDPTSTKGNSLFTDETGHAGFMLKELTALAWLNWLYKGQDFTTFAKTVKYDYDLDWDKQNIKDAYEVLEKASEDYRL